MHHGCRSKFAECQVKAQIQQMVCLFDYSHWTRVFGTRGQKQWSAPPPHPRKLSRVGLTLIFRFSVKYTTMVVHAVIWFLFRCYANQPRALYSLLEFSCFSAICKVTTSDQATGGLGKGSNLTACLQGHLCDFYKTSKTFLGTTPNTHRKQPVPSKLLLTVNMHKILQTWTPKSKVFRPPYYWNGATILGRGTGAPQHPSL